MRSKILDYVDFEKANNLLEGFNKSTGFVTAILDLDGIVLSKSGWRLICTEFHRKNSKTAANCMVSDTILANKMLLGEKFHFYKCHNGLIDVAIPIVIKGEHIANLFTGQFFFEEPDISFFKKQAKLYGFDESTYLKNLEEVPVVSRDKVELTMNFLHSIMQMIIEMTADKLEQLELTEAIKKSEFALLETQSQLKQNVNDLLESQQLAHIGTWRLNLETDKVVWSEELYKMYGFDPTIPPPDYMEHMKIFTPESWKKLSSSLEQTRTLGIPYELELEMAIKGKPTGWMWVRGEAVKDSTGRITELRGAAQDITKRKEMEIQLINSEEKFVNLFNRAPLGYQSLDENGHFLEVNEAWLSTLGYEFDEVIGKWFGDFLADAYVEPFRERFPLFKSLGKIHSEFIMKHKDGTLKHISFEGRIGYKQDGSFEKTHCILQDITEKKMAQEKIIESEQTYKALHEFSGVGIGYYSPDGHVISYNQRAAANMGGSSTEFVGKSLFDLFPKETADYYLERIKKCISSETPQNYDDLVELPSGDLWFFSTYTCILDVAGNVKGVQIISQDITEIKIKEKKIEYLSYHDQLTGLYNRRFFEEELERLDTSRNLPLTIAMGDVNGLKLVNDSFGHQTGDQLLIKVAEVLRKACREDDIIARMGGDEFSILFQKTDEADAEKIIQRINRYLSLEKIGPLDISVSIGHETKYGAEESIDELIKKTEDHMYRHKLNNSASLRYKTINLIMATLLEKNIREQKHSERVSSICVEIASAMSFERDEINHIKTAGLMHDIGKIGIDESILNSKTILSNDEWKDVKRHSEIGFRILSSSPEFSDIAEAVYSHHERWDGKGYPRGIKGESISIFARVITVADAFDAMISERPYRAYKKSMSIDEAINEIKRNAGTQFDPEIAKVFVEKVLKKVW